MSLTELLEEPSVRRRFSEEFVKPVYIDTRGMMLRAQPLTNDQSRRALIGTAFDYLFRFFVKRLNPSAIANSWIAEEAVIFMEGQKFLQRVTGLGPDGEPICDLLFDHDKTKLCVAAREALEYAKRNYSEYIDHGTVNDAFLASTLSLAKLDIVRRTGKTYHNVFDDADKSDIADLKNLFMLLDSRYWKSDSNICLLNPTFGEKASDLVGGADADLVIDHLLIDVKTVKESRLERKYINQLIGYYALYKIAGIDGLPRGHEIKRLGVYFSRHGCLQAFSVEDVIDQHKFPAFLRWFKSL